MNLILIHPDEVRLGQTRLTDHRCDHLRKVLKVRSGDMVRIGIIGGLMGEGLISAISRQEVVLQVRVDTPPPPKLGLALILALPRPIMLKRVLAQATALGVDHIHLVNAGRVEKSFFEASPVKEQGFAPYLINGLEQAVDTILPTVTVHPRFRPFIEDVVPTIPARRKLIAHPDGGHDLTGHRQALQGEQGMTLLAIGPEGGWLDYEVGRFEEAGFLPFTLGPRILRVDTAVPAIIAQLSLLLRLAE